MTGRDSLRKGTPVLVFGRVAEDFGDHVEVTFAPWWPRWSAILVNRRQVLEIPMPIAGNDNAAAAPVG